MKRGMKIAFALITFQVMLAVVGAIMQSPIGEGMTTGEMIKVGLTDPKTWISSGVGIVVGIIGLVTSVPIGALVFAVAFIGGQTVMNITLKSLPSSLMMPELQAALNALMIVIFIFTFIDISST